MRSTATPTDRPSKTDRRGPTGGWRIVARKEFADHLLSVRFVILALLIGLAAVASAQSAADGIREAAPQAADSPALFLRLFTISPERVPSFFALVGFLGPLLGIAFGFDAVNSERAGGTLPRLLAQPIHRDDVVNGKFAAGLALVALILVMLTSLVTGFGLFRLGITPSPADVGRLVAFLVVAVLYVGVWLALSLLFSVALRGAATSALAAISAWLVFTVFSTLIFGVIADRVAPVSAGEPRFEEEIRNARIEQTISRFSPETLYEESALALLDPQVRSLDILLPEQVDRAVPGTLPLPQSLLVVWPQITALGALIMVTFAGAYLLFLRQEVRA